MMTLEHDFEGFAEEELEARKALSFPPATHCAIIHFRGEAEFPTQRFAEEFGEHLKKHLPETTHFSMPAPSPVAKIKNKFRFQMLLRDANINRLVKILRYIVLQTKPPKDIEVYVDVDPYSLM
jgi:primosomal protein N' (replication factor Y)